ncbi:hypothetical protein PAT3040_01492 [Paenibacillus agaridevorans]|uniref:ABC transporter substrate-binding protein n=2 Tax=Paenibacillus agaridevorans TaxID=171404 RepID=A0A2R5EJY8_9BACL|nr:hypothetical protein PAT3040_01492 [Paenibacillus agaridevorans]
MSIVMVVVLTACSKNNGENSVSSNAPTSSAAASETSSSELEPVTLTIFADWVINPLSKNIQTDPVMEEIRKKTGITLDFEPFLGNGDASAKLSALLASNELPDIIVTSNNDIINKLVQNKKVMALDDLVTSRGQNLTQNFSNALNLMRLQSPVRDGKLYFIPGDINGGDYNPYLSANLWSVRWDLYDKLGRPAVNTLDEFVDLLKKMQELEPKNKDGKDNYGLGLFMGEAWGGGLVTKGGANAAGMVDAGGNGIFLRDVAKDELVPRLSDPNSAFWESLEFYNKAYREGVLDPESATMKFGTILEKAGAGRYLASYGSWLSNGQNEKFIADGTPEKGYVTLPIATKSENIFANAVNDAGNQFKWGISTTSKNAERVMDLFNFLATYEATELIVNGPQGLTWDMVDGKPALTAQAIEDKKSDPDYSKKTGSNLWSNMKINGNYDNPAGWKTNFTWSPEYIKANLAGAQKNYIDAMGYNYPMEGIDSIPNNTQSFSLQASLHTEAGSDLATKETNIATYAGTATAVLIFEKTEADFLAGKEKIINELKKMGIEEVFTFYHDEYARIKEEVANMK